MAGSFFVEDGYDPVAVDTAPKQPLDADLTAIAALSGTGFLKSTAGVWTLEASIPSSTSWGSITGTLSSQTDLQSALDAKAASVHTHDDRYYTETETDTLLSGKADSSHNHDSRYYTEYEIDGIVAGYQPLDADLTAIGGLAGTSGYLKKTAANTWTLDTSTFAASSHTHAQSDITNLVTDLAGKAATSHTHAQSDITNLVTDLAGKAAASHTHTASNISDSTTAGRALLTAVDAAAQRTSLSLVVGTNVQAWDADLDAIAALAGTSGFLKKTGTNTWTLDTSTYLTGNQTVTLSGDVSGSGATAITATIGSNTVTNAKLAQVATATFKGRVTAATGNVEDLTGTQATTLLDTFTSTLKGLAPASGGGTTNFLRADGSWAAPPSGGSPAWGAITGTLSSQTDLQTALNGKQAVDADLTAIAALATTGTLRRTGTDTWALASETGSGNAVYGTAPALSAPTFSTAATVTAGTNAQGQGALTSDLNIITTAASNPSGVTLPTATVGRFVKIVNKGANAINVYPATGASIDALAANASIQIAVNGEMLFWAASTTRWYSSVNSVVNVALATGTLPVARGGSGQTTTCASLTVANAFTGVGAISVNGTGSIGHGTGAGGAVTQATSKATAVTLNKRAGRITTAADALAAGASVSFTVNNTTISASAFDTVLVSGAFVSVNPASYRIEVSSVGASSFVIRITNITGGSLSEALAINFIALAMANA